MENKYKIIVEKLLFVSFIMFSISFIANFYYHTLFEHIITYILMAVSMFGYLFTNPKIIQNEKR
jgi:hypothetical protein